MKKIILIGIILICNYLHSQSVVLKTSNNLFVFSDMSNDDFDIKTSSQWDGNVTYINNKIIITGSAIISTSSKVGYLLGVIEVNYNHQAQYYSDVIENRKIIRIYKALKNKKGYENNGTTYIISDNETRLAKPFSNSKWILTLKKATLDDIKENDIKAEPYVRRKDSINNEREKYRYEREQNGYEYYYKYVNTVDEIKVRQIVDSISNDIKEPFECELKCLINSDGDINDVVISSMNASYQYLFYKTKFSDKLTNAFSKNKLKTKPITVRNRNFYSYYEFNYKHKIKK